MHLPALVRGLLVIGLTGASLSGPRILAQKSADSPLIKVAEHKMAHARLGAAVAVLGDHIYIFGGSGGGAAIAEAERLDTRTGKLEVLRGRFLARRYHSVVEYEGKFHLFGGDGYTLPGRAHEAKIEIYDPVEGTVTLAGEMPRPRAKAGTVMIGREAWLIGGVKHRGDRSFSQTNEVEIFDFETGQWRQGPPMPTPREAPAVVVGAFVVVPGGYASRNKIDAVEMYVPREKVWKRLPALKPPVSAHSAAFLGRWIFLFGDYDESDMVLAYELSSRKTTRLRPGFTDSRSSTAVVHGERIYVIGGNASDSGASGGRRARGGTIYTGSERELIQVFALNPNYKAP